MGGMDTHGYVLKDGLVESGLYVRSGEYSEALKGSNLKASGAIGFNVVGGEEDGIDCVRGSGYWFSDGVIEAGNRTRTFVTLKGGIDGVVLKDVELVGKCRWPWQVSLGDHTIYNKGRLMGMRGVVLDGVRRGDGKAVWVLVLDCEKPECRNGKYRVVKVPKWLVWLFMKLKG